MAITEAAYGKNWIQGFAGCETEDVITAVGVRFSDLYPEPLNGEYSRKPIRGQARFDARQVLECIAHEVMVVAVIADKYAHRWVFGEQLIGGAAIDATGAPLPARTISCCEATDAVFLGADGGPKWSDPKATLRPEQGLLQLRSILGVYANIRPIRIYDELVDASPLKAEILKGVDMLVIRELTGGIYFGKKTRDEKSASDLCTYTVHEVERIIRVAAEFAQKRRGKLCSVDKANVLETSRLWRDVTNRLMAAEFPDIEVETLLVDAAAMHLLSRPADFDVIVTENMFGDILTDEGMKHRLVADFDFRDGQNRWFDFRNYVQTGRIVRTKKRKVQT